MFQRILLSAMLAATLSAQSTCYILLEPAVGSIGIETHKRIQNNQEELTKALGYNTVFKLTPGTKFCDTKEFSYTWGAKRVNTNNQLLWISPDVKAEEV